MPVKYQDSSENVEKSANIAEFDEFDGWGGAIKGGIVYVKECRSGNIVKKSQTTPFKRGMIKNRVVFYYLLKGETPPNAEEMIPSIWGEE